MSEAAYTTATRIKSIEKADSTPESRYNRWNDELVMAEKEVDNFRKQGALRSAASSTSGTAWMAPSGSSTSSRQT